MVGPCVRSNSRSRTKPPLLKLVLASRHSPTLLLVQSDRPTSPGRTLKCGGQEVHAICARPSARECLGGCTGEGRGLTVSRGPSLYRRFPPGPPDV